MNREAHVLTGMHSMQYHLHPLHNQVATKRDVGMQDSITGQRLRLLSQPEAGVGFRICRRGSFDDGVCLSIGGLIGKKVGGYC